MPFRAHLPRRAIFPAWSRRPITPWTEGEVIAYSITPTVSVSMFGDDWPKSELATRYQRLTSSPPNTSLRRDEDYIATTRLVFTAFEITARESKVSRGSNDHVSAAAPRPDRFAGQRSRIGRCSVGGSLRVNTCGPSAGDA
jgi:hypothetical protein